MKSPAAIIKTLIFKYGTSFRRKALWVAIPGLIITSVVYTFDAVRTEKAIMKGEITKRAEVVAHLASRIGELPLEDYKKSLVDLQRRKEKAETAITGILLRLREEIR